MTEAAPALRVAPMLERLRAETRDAHAAIERSLDWRRRTATRAGYQALLARFYGFHATWEPAAAGVLPDAAFFDPRRRTHLLAADLLYLGMDREAIGGLPVCRLRQPASEAEALGGLYVLEGSTLGGQLVARHVAATLGLTGDAGLSYYTAHGAQCGRMWRLFCSEMNARLRSQRQQDDAIDGAGRTFTELRGWLA